MLFLLVFSPIYLHRHNTEGMEGSIPYIEIAPCKEEEPTNDEMNLRGRPLIMTSYIF